MEQLNNVLGNAQDAALGYQLPTPSLRNYYRDENERVFWVEGEIGENLLNLVKMVMRCNKEDEGIDIEKRKRRNERKPCQG